MDEAPPRKAPTEHRMTLTLSNDHHEALEVLRMRKHATKVDIIRGLIESAYRMTVARQPFCADGQGCRCAMLHTQHEAPPHLQQPQGFAAGGTHHAGPGAPPPGLANPPADPDRRTIFPGGVR